MVIVIIMEFKRYCGMDVTKANTVHHAHIMTEKKSSCSIRVRITKECKNPRTHKMRGARTDKSS